MTQSRITRYTFLMKRIVKKILLAFLCAILIFLAVYFSIRPSNDRDWTPDQSILATAEIDGNAITFRNIRNFEYRSTTDYTPSYYDKTFDLEKIKAVYFIVEPFSGYKGAAHTFLSFEFEGDNFVAVSVEIRKEKGEIFSAYKGLMRQYELMYVIADERDVVKLRSNFRKDLVYVYPAKTTKEKMQALFLDIANRVNELAEKPEFYNTITNTCTTNIFSHVNRITPGRIPLSTELLLPENSDRKAFELGLIDTDITSFEDVRKAFLINERAEQFADDPQFSLRIRGR